MPADEPYKYPLDLVATLAARLLNQDDFREAVRRAICLLDEADAQLAKDARERDEEEIRHRQEGWDYWGRLIPFKEALRTITGDKNPSRAKKTYIELLKEEYPHWTQERIDAQIKDNANGIAFILVKQFKEKFLRRRRLQKKFLHD